MKTIESLGDLKGKRVLVRSDFNVPLDADKNITDDGRIQAALPTLRTLLDAGAKVIITAHLGRPKGQVNPDYSLAPVANRLAEVTGVKVTLAEDTVGESAKAAVAAAGDGEIVLLENVRFNAAETSKDDAEREAFAAELAALADVFVSDGFGVVHRKQASVYDIALRLPAAMPYFLGGLKIAGGLALIGAVVAEFVAGSAGQSSGLASRIIEAGYRLNAPRLFAALILISFTGIVIFLALSWLSNRILRRWHESALSQEH